MERKSATNKVLEKLNLVSKRGGIDVVIDDFDEIEEQQTERVITDNNETKPEPKVCELYDSLSNEVSQNIQILSSLSKKCELKVEEPESILESLHKLSENEYSYKVCQSESTKKIKKKSDQLITIDPICIKFGSNEHPLLKYWLAVLSFTGSPVSFFSVSVLSNHKILKKFISLIFPFILLMIYHGLFVMSAANILKNAVNNELNSQKYYSFWLELYPIIFNLAVIVVNDVMWTIGIANGCWMREVLQSFKDMPPAKEILTEIEYNYFGREHWIYMNGTKYRCGSTETKTKLQLRTDILKHMINFGVRQVAAIGCCFTYLYVHYYLLRSAETDIYFILEIINIVLTCSSWLAILWTYMTLCQVLQWRFQHLNDWIWHFRRQRKLPTMRQFHIMIATYQSYINLVSIVDDYFKYWIFGVFGVLFFQVSIYFQYVINSLVNKPPSISCLVIPLITIPFISALLYLIKRAANVNAESKVPDEIIVQICLNTRVVIPDNLYKKMKFFIWLVHEGSSLTIFGLVNITKEFMGTAIAVIFSYTFLLHELTPIDSPCGVLAKNISLGSN